MIEVLITILSPLFMLLMTAFMVYSHERSYRWFEWLCVAPRSPVRYVRGIIRDKTLAVTVPAS
jgi:hypothetical protein